MNTAIAAPPDHRVVVDLVEAEQRDRGTEGDHGDPDEGAEWVEAMGGHLQSSSVITVSGGTGGTGRYRRHRRSKPPPIDFVAVDPQLAEADGRVDDHVGRPIGTEVQHHGVAVVGPLVAVDDDVAVVDVGADLERDVRRRRRSRSRRGRRAGRSACSAAARRRW